MTEIVKFRPEEINEAIEGLDGLRDIIAPLLRRINGDGLGEQDAQQFIRQLTLAKHALIAMGDFLEEKMPLARAHELAQAEKDGRLVVLPVKEGTKIYRLGYRLGGAYAIEERYFSLTYHRNEVLGKTIFLTREEAEAARRKAEPAHDG